ncbi:phospholipase D family protein [Shewanella donghaensis]|uniref:phospholipase D family protein n=1 Tax=Shewanella donghaensis TaxID=238836 RepID=UPI001D040517|nr:phospholipase D family protein [Shewanella donghaensis]
MCINISNKWAATVFMALAALIMSGCSMTYPEIDSSFESDWKVTEYQGEVSLIASAPEALARRIEFIRQAQNSVEMTHFSWKKDTSGLLLFNELKKAADRGVKVRISLDDLLVFNDKWMAELAFHDNIDIRLFNPFNSRKLGWMGRAFDFQFHQAQLDNRLHEKYFNVDGKIMILGGRNIGDDYFGYNQKANFFDLDAIFKGEIVSAFEDNFDSLWNSEHLTAITALVEVKHKGHYYEFNQALVKQTNEHQDVVDAIEQYVSGLNEIDYIPAKISPVFDSLAKLEDSKPYFRTRLEHLMDADIENAKKAVISTPYVIPTDKRFTALERLTANGANVILITNSSASNDSAFVPAYFEEYRPLLLDMGVDLYEFKDDAVNEDYYYHVDTYYHNKTLIIDDRYSYIGSSNFDPRSDFINIEFGVYIDSREFAKQLESYLLDKTSALYWHVTKDENGEIHWQSDDELHHSSPNYSDWNKVPNWFIRGLNLESEL